MEKKTLKDSMPYEFQSYTLDSCRAVKFMDIEVLEEFDGTEVGWIGLEKNVYKWVKLANGYAVGWNENPARGWSFPVKKIK